MSMYKRFMFINVTEIHMFCLLIFYIIPRLLTSPVEIIYFF